MGRLFGMEIELLLVGYDHRPWTPIDSLLIYKLIGFSGLADSQMNGEKFIVTNLINGVDPEKMQLLFPNLKGIHTEVVESLKKVRPSDLDSLVFQYQEIIPTAFVASNNWAVSPFKTTTGSAFQANDPHLMINHLPAVWYEFSLLSCNERDYMTGISLAGIPALIMGRNKDLSFGFTYGFIDQIDLWVEEVRDGRFRNRKGEFDSLTVRESILNPKGAETSISLCFYSTESGQLLRSNHSSRLEDGFYLSWRWSFDLISHDGVKGFFPFNSARSVHELNQNMRYTQISLNLVSADRHGNIAYQQVGSAPIRDPSWSGLYPGLGWDEKYAWKGLYQPEDLLNVINPPEGFIVTANNHIVGPGMPNTSVNLCMGSNRLNRAISLLNQKQKVSLEDMKSMQADSFSTQAQQYVEMLRGMIYPGESPFADLLYLWDFQHNVDCNTPSVFQLFFENLFAQVFGSQLGFNIVDHFHRHQGLVDFFHWTFDNVLLDEEKFTAFFSPQSMLLSSLISLSL